jgi:glutathione peroxidase
MAKLVDALSMKAAKLFFKGMEFKRRITEGAMKTDQTAAPAGEIYKFTMKTTDGKDKPLSDYKGKVLLVVNTASLCGFTPQYDGMEELYKKYAAQGLAVLAFPANEFGAQEPGADAQIKEFCRTKYSISFDLFSKIVVKGKGVHPLYEFLTTRSGFNGEIPWNFAKFVVSKDGRVAARFGPDSEPMDKDVVGKIEELLKA